MLWNLYIKNSFVTDFNFEYSHGRRASQLSSSFQKHFLEILTFIPFKALLSEITITITNFLVMKRLSLSLTLSILMVEKLHSFQFCLENKFWNFELFNSHSVLMIFYHFHHFLNFPHCFKVSLRTSSSILMYLIHIIVNKQVWAELG